MSPLTFEETLDPKSFCIGEFVNLKDKGSVPMGPDERFWVWVPHMWKGPFRTKDRMSIEPEGHDCILVRVDGAEALPEFSQVLAMAFSE